MSSLSMRPRIIARLMSIAILAASASANAEPAKDPITVLVDQARLLKAPDQVSTLVIGNPLIADVTLQPGGMMVVTGKGYGVTNLIAMDRSGRVIEEHNVQVQAPTTKLVTVYRGIERETYSCTPSCERRVMLGDRQAYFNESLGQANTLTDRAASAAASARPTPAGAMGGGAQPQNSSSPPPAR